MVRGARRLGFNLLAALCVLVFVRSAQQQWQLRHAAAASQPLDAAVARGTVSAVPGAPASTAVFKLAPLDGHEAAPPASSLSANSVAAAAAAASPPPPPPPPPASSSRVVVSLMMPAIGKNESRYTDCLVFLITTLRAAGWRDDVLVLATHDANSADVERVRSLGVQIKRVTNIAALSSSDPSMLSMFTKLHAWNLTQYAQVAFYDSDHVFLGDPSAAFDECGEALFCATGDTGIKDFYHRPDVINEATYFNAGFMLLRPNATAMEWLMSMRHLGEGTPFVDQDMLNNVFSGKWKRLDERYNRMHTYRRGITDGTVAIHEKFWVLRQHFPEPHWRWNKDPLSRLR
jgi:hypothetical protein